MEREVSMVVEIGVALIALAAFIFILWFTVFMGEDMANNMGQEAGQILATTQSGTLEELKGTYTILPTSGVYSILRANESSIGRVDCRICGSKKKDGSCLLGHLDGRANLEVQYEEAGGWYKLIVHKPTCEWYYNTNCYNANKNKTGPDASQLCP